MMDTILLTLAIAAGNPATALPCLPAASDRLAMTSSAIEDHRTLRKALDEPMPQYPNMVMLYGKGGHLATREYSIIVVRAADGSWRGTAVGRSQIWIKDAPYIPMQRIEWVLEKAAGRQLDEGLGRRCPSGDKLGAQPGNSGPPPRELLIERMDVVMPGHSTATFAVDDKIAALIRPPQ